MDPPRERFRFGASSLLNDVLMQIRKEKTGRYQSGDYFTIIFLLCTVGAFATAGVIHKRTFRSPNDVTAQYRKEGGTEHAPAGGPEGRDTGSVKTGH